MSGMLQVRGLQENGWTKPVDLAAVQDDAPHGMSIVVILLNMAERLQLCQGRKELDMDISLSLELQAGTVVTHHIQVSPK